MKYETALKKTHDLLRFGINPGLEHIKYLMDLLGNPQEKLQVIHVAGTNGKGSTVCMISNCLISAGYKTGMYTSPYVVDFRERMQINGKYIPKAAYARCAEKVFGVIDKLPLELGSVTEFEFITAVAFLWFADSKCDYVVLETGLGGRLDATNVISKPLVSVITSISLDHTDILGDTIEAIAAEKCGIIKQGGITVTAPMQDDAALGVIYEHCALKQNKLYMPSISSVRDYNISSSGAVFSFGERSFRLSMTGSYQIVNALTAIQTIDVLNSSFNLGVSENELKEGLKKAEMPARFERIETPYGDVILDCTHNLDGAKTLVQTIQNNFGDVKFTAVCGMLADKNVHGVISEMAPYIKSVVTVLPENGRAMSPLELKNIFKDAGVEATEGEISYNFLTDILRKKDDDLPLLVFGSFYIVSPIRLMLT